MKKQAFITILLTVLMSMPMFAYDFTYGNINYNIVDNNSVEVTWGNYSGDIYIYGSVYYNGKSYSVTGIGYEAFCEETKVVYVSLPSTVTYISNSAFENTRITNMTIPNSVKSIGRSAFSYCSKLTTVTIPNSVTSIGVNVFYNFRVVKIQVLWNCIANNPALLNHGSHATVKKYRLSRFNLRS